MKRTTLIITAAILLTALAVATVAVPVSYHPTLSAVAPVAVKAATSDAAGFAGSAAKRVAAVARKRSTKRTHRTRTAATAPATTTDAVAVTAPVTVAVSDAERAQTILAGLIAKYPILAGTTVEMGDALGYQAVAYYRSGRIIISTSHTATLERILNHEIWHVIDYRDNGTINWGENLPPANASSYAAF